MHATTALVVVVVSALVAFACPPEAAGPLLPEDASVVLAQRVVVARVDERARELVSWHGGPTTTAGGEVVDVLVSDVYTGAVSTPQWWADFFGALVHGAELTSAHVLVAPLDQVQLICGPTAIGCYGGDVLVVPGELPPAIGVSPAEVARHEYGHHLGLHRLNPPWQAIEWGTKRWATSMQICARARAGTVAPGDEGSRYAQNPGEGLAESYRVLNELAADEPFTWDLLDPVLRPDDKALAALREDVLSPWSTPTLRTIRTRFTGMSSAMRSWRLELPLDGLLRIDATFPLGSPYSLVLRDAAGRTIATGQWSGARTQTATVIVCGERSATLQVVRSGDPGAVELRVSTP